MVAKPRANRRHIAELSFVLRAILDRMAASGGPKGKAHRAALDLVDAFVRGQMPTPDALRGAREGVAKVVERLGVGSPPLWKALYWLPVPALLHMIERCEDLSDQVLQRARYAVDTSMCSTISARRRHASAPDPRSVGDRSGSISATWASSQAGPTATGSSGAS